MGALSILVIPLAYLVMLASFLVAEHTAFHEWLFPIDDVWIHLELAKNLAHGDGFAFNPGEPIAASTAPLYTVILAALFRISDHAVRNAYVVSVGGALVGILTVLPIVRSLTGSLPAAVLTGFVVATEPWMVWVGLSGMEVGLGCAVVGVGVLCLVRSEGSNDWRRWIATASFSMLPLIRPESYAILALYFAFELFEVGREVSSRRVPRSSALRRLALKLLLAVAILSPYALFAWWTTGSPLPNTFAAKVGDLSGAWLLAHGRINGAVAMLWSYVKAFLQVLHLLSPVAVFFALPGCILLAISGVVDRDARVVFLGSMIVTFVIAVGLVVPVDLVSSPWPRHMLHLFPSLLALGCSGFYRFCRRSPALMFGCVAAVAIAHGITVEGRIVEARGFLLNEVSLIARSHLPLARWIAANVSPQAVVAASDIGVVGYETENRIVDTEGLIDPGVRRTPQRRDSPEKDRTVLALLEHERPDFLVKYPWVYPTFDPAQFPLLERFGGLGLYRTPWTRPGSLRNPSTGPSAR